MKLDLYLTGAQGVTIRPAPFEREWMEATAQRYAYRCLPLNIANAHGWELLCPSGFSAVWDGGDALESIAILSDDGRPAAAISHFGHGVLTFHIPALFRTEPGYDLMVQGPINRPRDAVSPLSGVVETDWAPFTFTMNWRCTRPGASVRFEKDDVFCHVFPIARSDLEGFEPRQRQLSEARDLQARYQEWNDSRERFNVALAQSSPEALAQQWQKHYYRGVDLAGEAPAGEDHRTRVRLKPFVRAEDEAS